MTTLFSMGVVTFFVSCESSSKQDNATNKKNTYFDMPAYFEKQVATLKDSNPMVLKTVATNQETEEKEVHISNWSAELSPFLAVDLNKEAYKDHIVKDSISDTVTYTLSGKNIDLNKVVIVYNKGIPTTFEVEKTTNNMLYETTENLRYEEGKFYSIKKTQVVFLIGKNDYLIQGIIK